jgi:hypothetical protein
LSLRAGGNIVAVSDEAIQIGEALTLDCFASLAMTRGELSLRAAHRAGEAIYAEKAFTLDCFALLAMPGGESSLRAAR